MALGTLPEHISGPLSAFTEDLHERLGKNLLSVTVYGSAARGDFVEGVSDVNVLVVAKTLPPEALKEAGAAVRHWRERIPLSPIFATADYLDTSSDVFPLEFLDMKAAHAVLHGADPFRGLNIDLSQLRHEVESELKGKLMRLRSAYARTAAHPVAVCDLMRESLSSFGVLFRGVLQLRGETPPERRADVLRAVADVYGLDSAALEAVERVHRNARRMEASEVDALFARYLGAIERLVAIVDTWNGAPIAGAPAKTDQD